MSSNLIDLLKEIKINQPSYFNIKLKSYEPEDDYVSFLVNDKSNNELGMGEMDLTRPHELVFYFL